VLKLMHFADELVDAGEVRHPNALTAGKREMAGAKGGVGCASRLVP
jgi:hypothetical protein